MQHARDPGAFSVVLGLAGTMPAAVYCTILKVHVHVHVQVSCCVTVCVLHTYITCFADVQTFRVVGELEQGLGVGAIFWRWRSSFIVY